MALFNPKDYLSTKKDQNVNEQQQPINLPSVNEWERVEQVIQQIEASGIDITAKYEDWLKIGFAFADAFGSTGSDFFHRVSRNYSGYDHKQCQSQYQHCLQSKKNGATLGTFFFLAEQAGIIFFRHNERKLPIQHMRPHTPTRLENIKPTAPKLPNDVFKGLPKFLKAVVNTSSSEQERDLLLLGGLTVISACLPNVYGIYDQNTVYPNLFLFVTAPASSGKGRINLCRRLVAPIHKQKRQAADAQKVQYEVEMAEYHELKRKRKGSTPQKPSKPKEEMLFIPANSSATGTFELLANNDGKGLIFETEGDTLAQAFKSEYGNYSDGFRKAFHHEAISYYRRTDSEYVHIECPQISAILTGTPDQVLSLMPDSENGLFSRFIFYKMERQKAWRNVFANSQGKGLNHTFELLGQQYPSYYQTLETFTDGIKINLEPHHIDQFNDFFSKQYDRFLFLQKTGLEASLLRLGLICYRVMMVLSTIRMLENNTLSNKKTCDDCDVEIALSITKTLLVHTEQVFLYLPEKKLTLPRKRNYKETFLDELPSSFSTREYKNIAEGLQIPEKTAERYIKQFIGKGYLQRIGHGQYLHLPKKED